MKLFVLSLKDSERRDFVQQQMKVHNLNFEYFDAVNGKNLSAQEINKYCDIKAIENSPKWLNRGAIGCALSHLFIYERMLELNIDRAIIMEDDMLLNKDFVETYDFLKNKDLEEEVILLYYRSFSKLKFSKINTININSNFKICSPISLDDIPMANGCYYITRSACKKLVETILPIRVTADSWRYFFLKSNFLHIKTIFPRLIDDAGFKSEIDYHESYSNKYILGFKTIIDKINNPLINKFAKLRRKRSEKTMSNFSLVADRSTINDQRTAIVKA